MSSDKASANASKSEPTHTTNNENDEEELDDNSAIAVLQQNRPLRMTLSVDSPSFLKVKLGQKIKQGDIISDNSIERNRLNKQRQSLQLQIDNLKSKSIPKPFEPKAPPQLAPLPSANFLEEESAIAQAKLKLQQAQSILESRTKLLNSDNPEVRAEGEKAESALNIASHKVQEQEELLRSMQDMKLEASVLRHEEAKLKQLNSEMEQARSGLDQARAKLNASAIASQQELQSLQIAVQIAQSDLQMAMSRLETARNNRKLVEYQASIEAAQRVEQQNQSNLAYTRQMQDYEQQIRDRDYQLAQLQISLAAIDDKISQIPVVKSPKTGYIRRIKPWVGNNGKYTTTITISSSPKSGDNRSDRSSDGADSTSTKASPTGTTTTGATITQ
ncbi:hypothetical protein [Fischerella sp.]|uniref:hypothetical protein n=1 Tax=Fischerella sp. TaxID=1191 RepID=UPI0025BF6756|nr:hypothetical protein [Fischerella sp.]